jgi:ribonuclease D
MGANKRESVLNYQMITTNDELASLCEVTRDFPAIALDTEFVRTRTYYPQLGLIQMYDGKHVSLIDPLGITDWTPMRDLLLDTAVTKYLHAGSEDLEVFLNTFGIMPQPLIDTQILAAFSNRPLSWGFAAMVEEYTGLTLDKSESRTDWLARPLTERQLEYAAADVFYLLPIAGQLMKEAEASGWLPAALDECRMTQLRRQEVVDPKEAWRDISNAWQLRTRQLACLQLLADWRCVKRASAIWPLTLWFAKNISGRLRAICRAAWASWTALGFRAAKSVSTVKPCWRWSQKRRRCRKRRCRNRC